MAEEPPPPTYQDAVEPQPYSQQPVYAGQQVSPQEQPYYAQQPQQAYAPQEQPYYAAQPQTQPPPQQQQPVYVPQQPVYAPQQQAPYGAQPVQYATSPPMDIAPPADPSAATIDKDTGYGTSEYGERLDYQQPVYQDKVWAIVWLVHLAIMIIVLFGSFGSSTVGSSSSTEGYLIVFVCGVLGTALGYLWTIVLRRCAGKVIKFMMWANLIMLIISTIITFGAGLIFNGIILLIITIFFALYMWRVWRRIPFAEAMIMIASDIIQQYTGIIWVALLMLAAQVAWILIWGGTVSILLASGRLGESYAVLFILMLSLYWNLETFKNLCHCTVCGVAASWYFSPYPQSPTKASLKRSCTTSLGSVALGSLIVSIIQAMRAIIRQMARDGRLNGCLACLIDCFLGCLERWIEWFNKYAYAHVAIYGESFINSAKQTWSLLKSKGIDAWINDDLTGFALICGAVIGGFICAAIAGLMVMVNDNLDDDLATAYAFLGFFIGFYLCWTVLNTVASCVVAIFVCYAEDPNAMEVNRPNDYHKLTAARQGISGADYDAQQQQQQQQQQLQQQQQAQPQQQQQQQAPPPQQYGNMYGQY